MPQNLTELAEEAAVRVFGKNQTYVENVESIIQTYIDDEFLIHSMVLCLISVMSFFPII